MNRAWVLAAIPFALMHLACLGALLTGVSGVALAVCLVAYLVRMFGITAGYHRYFAHRAFKTGRGFQAVLAIIGCASAQLGPLWWAAHHRHHHAFSDTERDPHSPARQGFLWSHMGWFLHPSNKATDLEAIRDFAAFPELRMLDALPLIAPTVLAFGMLGLGKALQQLGVNTSGPQMLVWGFFISTVLLYHGTFVINSLAHVFGSRRYETRDDSRNNALLALITLGEGWHNNHHRCPSACRQGFYWWELDITWLVLLALERAGLVWDIRPVPASAYRADRRFVDTEQRDTAA